MSAPEFRYASMHPALRFAGVMDGFDRDAFFKAVSEEYAPLSRVQEDELFEFVRQFLLQAGQYHLAAKRSDLEKFTADIGNRIDGLLSELAGPILGFEYVGDDEGDLVARFKNRTQKMVYPAQLEEDRNPASRFNQSRTVFAHLGVLFSFVHEGKQFPLDELSMSPENLLHELSKLRNYLAFLTLVYSSKTEVNYPGTVESQRSALHRLIEQTHEWAGREGNRLPRAAKSTGKAVTEFTLLIDLILREVDRWLVRFSTSGNLMSDDEDNARVRMRGQLIDMPNNLDALAKVIEKCITAANRRKRQEQQLAAST
jgi:hypothetical protein